MTKCYSVLVEHLIYAANEEDARKIAMNPNYESQFDNKYQLYAGDGAVVCMDDLITNEVSHES